MTDDERREAIKRMMKAHTKRVTVDQTTAFASLVADGFYREDGRLMPQYGGPLDPGEEDPWLYMLDGIAK